MVRIKYVLIQKTEKRKKNMFESLSIYYLIHKFTIERKVAHYWTVMFSFTLIVMKVNNVFVCHIKKEIESEISARKQTT